MTKHKSIHSAITGVIVFVLTVLLFTLLMTLGSATSAQAQSYEVFITQGEVAPQANTTVYHLSQGDALLKTINLQLGADDVMDEGTAATYVTQSLKDVLMAQMTGLTKAAQYQIKYLPAIVKDKTYVVYGSTDPEVFLTFGY